MLKDAVAVPWQDKKEIEFLQGKYTLIVRELNRKTEVGTVSPQEVVKAPILGSCNSASYKRHI